MSSQVEMMLEFIVPQNGDDIVRKEFTKRQEMRHAYNGVAGKQVCILKHE